MTDLWFDVTGSGPPVVLLHAGVVDSRIWDPVVPHLAERHRVIRYDQRGYGRSPMWTEPYSPVDDLQSVLEAAGEDRAALVGLSRGGRIALAAALERPESVAALVLVASGLSGHPIQLEATPEQDTRWEAADAAGDYAAMAEIDLEFWAPLGADSELRTMFLENAQASNSEDPTVEPTVAGRLEEIAAPTLVVTAGRDVEPLVAVADRVAREIPGARHAVIEEADHMVPWRSPEELSHLILRFLED